MSQNRQLAVVMFTDIVGYSSLMENDESSALYILEINRQITQSSLEEYNGNWTKEIGDGTLSTFQSTIDALNCATKILERIKEFPKLKLRIALHIGDIVIEDSDIFGDSVNITSRIQSFAPENGIAITQHFHAQLQGKTNYQFKSIGAPALKNINSEIKIFTWQPSDTKQSNEKNKPQETQHKIKTNQPSNNRIIYKLFPPILFIFLVSYFFWQQNIIEPVPPKTITPKINENSIAVLKFKHIGTPDENQYLNEGLSEELLNLLARIKELKVASRTSTWALPENVTSEMVGKQLGVNYLVEGSVRRLNNKVRITVQLINTKTGFHIWTETYDREMSDTINIQDEIAQNITKSLKLLLSAQSIKSLSEKKPIDATAYDEYLQAKRFLRLPKSLSSLSKAITHFNSALQYQSAFELAYAGLCNSQIEFYKLTSNNEDYDKAEKTCLKILKSDSYQSEIYNSLGKLYLISGNYKEAKTNFEAALTLDLSSTDALIGLAQHYTQTNNYSLAEQYFSRAINVEPNNREVHQHYASYLYRQGENSQAINAYKKVIALTPNYAEAYNGLGVAYFANGEIERGIDTFRQSLNVNETQEAYSNLGTAYFLDKKFKQAAEMYKQAIKLVPNDYVYWGFLAESFENIANQEQAMNHAYSQAIKYAELARDINSSDDDILVSLALYYAKIKDNKKAIKALESLKSKELMPYMLYTLSISYLLLNQPEMALDHLQKSIEKGYDKDAIQSDDNFAALYDNKRFIALTTNE
jgi:TolB-like protein/class 3 adenylate cyclase/Tfp pilus assembly protein PilF